MSATQFGLGLLYIAIAVICYAAGWWQGKTVERERWQERAGAQDQLEQPDQLGEVPEVPEVLLQPPQVRLGAPTLKQDPLFPLFR